MTKQIPAQKKCAICGQFKTLTVENFSPCKTGKYGFYNYCKPCRNQRNIDLHPERERIDEVRVKRIGLRKLGLKRCASCKDILPLNDFYDDPRHADGKWSSCKECLGQKQNQNYLKKEYGITVEQFNQLMESQHGKCYICNRRPKKNKFNIDHCHLTHRIRGLVCVNCNTNLLPFVERFPEWVRNAFAYLENPPAFKVIGEIVVPETNQARKKEIETTKGKGE